MSNGYWTPELMASSVPPVLPLSGVPLFVYVAKFSINKTKPCSKTNLKRNNILSGSATPLGRFTPRSLFHEISENEEKDLLNNFVAIERV